MNDKPFECDATVLRDQLNESIGHRARVECVERLTSTNAVLKQDAFVSHGKFLLAGQQSLGVGRRGSVWQSPPEGNLYLSYCFHTETRLADLSLLPLAFALAIADSVESEWAVDVKIKWPNDLYIEGEKCGGILLETVSLPGDSPHQRTAGHRRCWNQRGESSELSVDRQTHNGAASARRFSRVSLSYCAPCHDRNRRDLPFGDD
jgi:hypothetical protein